MERQAARRRGHAVVVGVGTIGYRVVGLFDDLRHPRRRHRAVARLPVPRRGRRPRPDARRQRPAPRGPRPHVGGDGPHASSPPPTTTSSTSARASRPGRSTPAIRTVARIYDETIAEHVSGALGVDVVVSASRAGRPGLRRRRPRRPGARDRCSSTASSCWRSATPSSSPPSAAELAAWRAEGVHLVAVDDTDGHRRAARPRPTSSETCSSPRAGGRRSQRRLSGLTSSLPDLQPGWRSSGERRSCGPSGHQGDVRNAGHGDNDDARCESPSSSHACDNGVPPDRRRSHASCCDSPSPRPTDRASRARRLLQPPFARQGETFGLTGASATTVAEAAPTGVGSTPSSRSRCGRRRR